MYKESKINICYFYTWKEGGIKPEVTHADKVLESSVAHRIQSARLSVQSSELGPPAPSPAPPSLGSKGGDTFACGEGGVGT
jgi:hypothetical protein